MHTSLTMNDEICFSSHYQPSNLDNFYSNVFSVYLGKRRRTNLTIIMLSKENCILHVNSYFFLKKLSLYASVYLSAPMTKMRCIMRRDLEQRFTESQPLNIDNHLLCPKQRNSALSPTPKRKSLTIIAALEYSFIHVAHCQEWHQIWSVYCFE